MTMQRKRLDPPAGSRQGADHAFDPYETDAYDPLAKPPSKGTVPLDRDDSSNVNRQPRPHQRPSPPR